MNLDKRTQAADKFSLTHWYQPICNLYTQKVIGFEALVRSPESDDISPLQIFENARQEGSLNTLDRNLLLHAYKSFENHKHTALFMNAFPSTLLEEWFLPWWDEYIGANSQIILEVTESEPICDWERFKDIISELKQRKVKIALDDMGSGYSFFQNWIELDPYCIKLDRYYSADLAQNPLKQKLLGSLTELFGSSTVTILEGIETTDDLETAKQLGISYAQGYLLGRPAPLESYSNTDYIADFYKAKK